MLPILYSFRRCPYAMRARLAINYAGIAVELREVLLRDMPESLIAASPKSTVPVLILPSGEVIDESWDIVLWAIRQNDPDNWLGQDERHLNVVNELIAVNDGAFKAALDRYKYADRFPDHPAEYYRNQGEAFLVQLEERLSKSRFLLGDEKTVADIGIFPFIRQFSAVDQDWFDATPYRLLRAWLENWLAADLFITVMGKYTPWKPGDKPVKF
ncbi:MAG: glutathione S-transferase [Gammaproteobacteria bacterium]